MTLTSSHIPKTEQYSTQILTGPTQIRYPCSLIWLNVSIRSSGHWCRSSLKRKCAEMPLHPVTLSVFMVVTRWKRYWTLWRVKVERKKGMPYSSFVSLFKLTTESSFKHRHLSARIRKDIELIAVQLSKTKLQSRGDFVATSIKPLSPIRGHRARPRPRRRGPHKDAISESVVSVIA